MLIVIIGIVFTTITRVDLKGVAILGDILSFLYYILPSKSLAENE